MNGALRRLPGFRLLDGLVRQGEDASRRLHELELRCALLLQAQQGAIQQQDQARTQFLQAQDTASQQLDQARLQIAALEKEVERQATRAKGLETSLADGLRDLQHALHDVHVETLRQRDAARATQESFNLLRSRVLAVEDELEANKNHTLLEQVRAKRTPDPPVPLVSIVITTFNRSALLVERSLPSALAQTHPRIEVVVVGDGSPDDTEKRVRLLGDPRVRFVNLPRSTYPEDPIARWQVAGVPPANHGMQIARGEWIAHLDDDDVFTPDHVETLLAAARRFGAEFAYGVVHAEQADGTWRKIGRTPLACGHVSRMAVLHRRDLNFIEARLDAWQRNEPGDWNLWRRMQAAGVRVAFVDQVVGDHFKEGSQLEGLTA